MQAVFVICGNDGTGKSTTVELLNSRLDGQAVAIERNSKEKFGIDPSLIDDLTLINVFEDRDVEFTKFVLINGEEVPVYWAILDAPIDVLDERLDRRDYRDKWESRKSLFYFRKRFRELSAHFGIPIIDTHQNDPEKVVQLVIELPKWYQEIQSFALRNMTVDNVHGLDIEKHVMDEHLPKFEDIDDFIDEFFDPNNELVQKLVENNPGLRKKLLRRYFVNGEIKICDGNITIIRKSTGLLLRNKGSLLHLIAEGESKQVYRIITENPYLKDVAIIILKPTIYSHSKQATGIIEGLSEIRARGTQIFLEMMWRNDLNHSYRSINNHGVILSDYIPDVPITEIVVKKYCEGTDKHSYYGMKQSNRVVLETGEYKFGPYVRFDWRNPNHVHNVSRKSPSENPYYYVVEEFLGKEEFFEQFLASGYVRPFGDKNLSEDILHGVINTENTKRTVLKMFNTIQYYFRQVGLEIQDVCFMLDREGNTIWSEVNEDCMRIKTIDASEEYDKDIWRAGGSGSKDKLVAKWKIFNKIMTEYFVENRFWSTEMDHFNWYPYQTIVREIMNDPRLTITPGYMSIYNSMFNNASRKRRVIVTMDMYDGKPVLVKSGKIVETHSSGSWPVAFEKVSIFPDILVVDLDGALNKPGEDDENDGITSKNRPIIKQLATKYYVHSGGGLRTLEDVQDVLGASARRIVVGSNTDIEFIKAIPKDRLIVELSVDENNHVLIHGRKTNTKISIFDKLKEMADLGVEAVSMTFHHTEGHLKGIPRDQVRDIVSKTPKGIEKIIIAGGVSTPDDLEFLWSFGRVIPQLGSAIWKKKMTIGQIYGLMAKFNPQGICPAIIQDVHGRVKGLVYLDREALNRTCEERVLYRYSRKLKRVILKGEQSKNFQRVIKISLDCDSDALLITVDSTNPFCHTSNYSCFSLQTSIKANLLTLTDYIKSKLGSKSYTGVMQENPGLALAKLMEEFWEVVCASDTAQVMECSDLIVHLMMYLNGKGISMEDILNELNRRRWNPRLVSERQIKKRDPNKLILAITGSKYSSKTDKFAEDVLGIKIMRGEGRDLNLKYAIADGEKYLKNFENCEVVLVSARPKDMVWLVSFGRIDGMITYNTVVENFPKVYKTMVEVPDNDLRLCLIQRKDDIIRTKKFSKKGKLLVACEHLNHVHQHLSKSMDEEDFSLDRVIGSSEGYLVNTPKDRYHLCDAIVETGKTLEENDLTVFDTVLDHGDVKIGFYLDVRM